MYYLYHEKCEESNDEPVKLHMYRCILNREFNMDFMKPKKDRCDKCEEHKMAQSHNLVTEALETNFIQHRDSKEATRNQRKIDLENTVNGSAVVCFDLQNVVGCPRANISSFFYRRNLSVFNLTAHCSVDSSSYCALWHERMAGRGGNEIASALVAILEKVLANHSITELTLWSYSCVAQKRNSGISMALMTLQRNHDLIKITQKFCEPGHSSIQEVDNIHSHLECALSKNEVFSPLGVVRCFQGAMRKHVNIIQMQRNMFKQYLEAAKLYNFKSIPYAKVKSLTYTKSRAFQVEYQTSFISPESNRVSRRAMRPTRTMSPPRSVTDDNWPTVKLMSKQPQLSEEKKKDIRAMLKFMNPTDRKFMSGLSENTNE